MHMRLRQRQLQRQSGNAPMDELLEQEKQCFRHLSIYATDCLPSSANGPIVCLHGSVTRASIEKVTYGAPLAVR